MQNEQKANQAGFTLIELLVAVSLAVILMLGASAVLLISLLSNSKTNSTQLVKTQGEYALAQMEFLLRNAIDLQVNPSGTKCAADMDAIRVVSLDGGSTTFFAEEDSSDNDNLKIASNSGIYLTSGDVDLVSGPEFDCAESSDKRQRYVTIQFTLRKGAPGIDQEKDIVEQTFSTGVAIRN